MNETPKRRLAFRLLPLVLWLLPACQQQMAVQPSYREDEPSSFFKPNGEAARPPVAGTVARGYLRTDQHLFGERDLRSRIPAAAGAVVGAGGNPLCLLSMAVVSVDAAEYSGIDTFPFPVTAEVLDHGRNRYMIYCVVCHDPLGTGHGKIVERGYTPPPSYHSDRLRSAPVGHFFNVITRGYGSMPSYSAQVPPRDRWAIIAYVRALQLSQHFPADKLPEDLRREWQEKGQSQ